MKRFDFPLVSDVLFYGVACWFFTLGIMRYYRLPTAICITIATLISLALAISLYLLISRKHRRAALGKREREKKNALMLHLTLERPERIRTALISTYTADGKECRADGDALNIDGEIVVPLFTMQPVSADAVALLLREYGETPFVIACNELTPEAQSLLGSFGRKFWNGNDIYETFSRTETIPAQLICGEIPRKTARAKLVRAFSKKNARPFFVSGLLLLFMSLFTFFPTYYLVTGSILLASSVFVRALGYA